MNDVSNEYREEVVEIAVPSAKVLGRVVEDICEKALSDAKAQLHPLVRNVELDRLDKRSEFVRAFKSALEQRIAQKLAVWQPNVQAVFRFDELPTENREAWDGSVHLLVEVPRLSNAVKELGKILDQNLVKSLRQLGWSRYRKRQSILEIQQVTPNELRHGVSYADMFSAVYNVPVKVWPPKRRMR